MRTTARILAVQVSAGYHKPNSEASGASLPRHYGGEVVPVVGLEPTCPLGQRILSAPRLPFRHTGRCVSIP